MPSLVAEGLRRARLDQTEELLKIGVRLTDQTHVVAQADGQPLQPNSLTPPHPVPRLEAARHAASIQRRPPQGGAGTPGHSSVGITLDLYSHVLPGMQEDAAAKVDAAIRAAIDRS